MNSTSLGLCKISYSKKAKYLLSDFVETLPKYSLLMDAFFQIEPNFMIYFPASPNAWEENRRNHFEQRETEFIIENDEVQT